MEERKTKRLKTIKYISETSVEDIIKKVDSENMDVYHVIQAAKEARKEFGLKIEEVINELSKRITVKKFEVGMVIEAMEDCLNNFRKGERVGITGRDGDMFHLDSAAGVYEEYLQKYFRIIE